MTLKRTAPAGPSAAPSAVPPSEHGGLRTRISGTLLRTIRLHAALDAKSLDDFIREAIEERLGRRS
jgi:hypothetical protein